jgi:transcriptional regulator with XRE-family HTH domain
MSYSLAMAIGDRLREIREGKDLTQGDIEKRTGLLRAYISRVENGHTVPAISTLEKFARALGIPLYQLFYRGEESANPPELPTGKGDGWGSTRKGSRMLERFARVLQRVDEGDRKMLLLMAQKMARRRVSKRD